jgi:hypothetical protein
MPDFLSIQHAIAAAWGAIGGGVTSFGVKLLEERRREQTDLEDLGSEICAEAKIYWRKAGADSLLEAQLVRLTHKYQTRALRFADYYFDARATKELRERLMSVLKLGSGGDFGVKTKVANPATLVALSAELASIGEMISSRRILGTLAKPFRPLLNRFR